MGLIDWGIRIMDNVENDIQKIGQKFGFMPLSWQHVIMQFPAKQGLLWRVPDPQVPMASSLSRIQAILVNQGELAMVLKDGMLTEQVVLPPGMYDISRTVPLRGNIQVIWTSTSEVKIPWGVPDVITQDRVSIGASGRYTVAIVAPEIFLSQVAGHQQVYTKDLLREFAKDDLTGTVRDLMAQKTVMEFQLARNEFIVSAREMLQPIFNRWGLEFRGLSIENQNIPEEFRQAAAQRVKIQMEKEASLEGAKADVDLAQLEAQRRYYLAQAEATKHYVIGAAEVENMRRQIGIGLDPLKLKMAEAMEEFAKHPSEGTLVDGRAQIIAQLPGLFNTPNPGPANPNAGQPLGITGPANPPADANANASVNQAGQGQFAPFVPPATLPGAGTGATAQADTAGKTETMNRQKIEEMLDKLDERFANGEITEQTYLMMRDKWQKRLDSL